jgi:hypothetical protein
MTEPIYEYLRGVGWVLEAGRIITWADFTTYQFDNWTCVLCGCPSTEHYYGDGRVARCRSGDGTATEVVGRFTSPNLVARNAEDI